MRPGRFSILALRGTAGGIESGTIPATGAAPPADRWHVLAPDGRLLGAITLPRSVRVTRAGSDWLLGIWHDGDGTEHVQLLRVVKS